jgi:mono/diheme cytochrome c family protein
MKDEFLIVRHRRQLWRLALVISACVVMTTIARTQSTTTSVWDGTYTEAQAAEGEATYFSSCAECHGEDLAGREQAPALAGTPFMEKWNRATLRQLYEIIEQMPPDEPKSLQPKQYVDVLAYLLSANAFPAGSAALKSDRVALAQIQITNARPQK